PARLNPDADATKNAKPPSIVFGLNEVGLLIKNVVIPLIYAKKSYIPKSFNGANAIDKKNVVVKSMRAELASELVLLGFCTLLRVKRRASAGINNNPAHKKWLCNEIPPR
ncbi:MAG: hypothetical protein WCT36_06135, partial [Candidatus Gracilibacteria bacterium]